MSEMSESELRHALFGTWRLTSFQIDLDGIPFKPAGDDPVGYLAYTRDGRRIVPCHCGSARFAPRESRIRASSSRVARKVSR